MTDKKRLRTAVRRIEKVKTWQLVILLIMVGFVAATFLRLNNVGMVERRDAVLAADREGDREQVAKRLYDLQRYVSFHMNTDPGRVPLENIYSQDYQAIIAQNSNDSPSGNVYKLAADVCDPIGQAQGWRWPDPRYTNCIDQELGKYPAADDLRTSLQNISSAPYYHTFVSPTWSPDFAGWSLVVCLAIVTVIVLRLLILVLLRLLLKLRYRQA